MTRALSMCTARCSEGACIGYVRQTFHETPYDVKVRFKPECLGRVLIFSAVNIFIKGEHFTYKFVTGEGGVG